jgi:hypothetical protein
MNHATYTTGTQRMRITSIIKQGRSKWELGPVSTFKFLLWGLGKRSVWQ